MIPSNPIPEVPNYGSSAIYKDLPSPEQIRAGVIPLDSLPAAWWNALWACTNGAVNEARSAVGTLITEVCNAITGAGICINPSCVDQLYQAIDTIRQRVGNAITAGAVKSSSSCGEVSIDAQGIMTANGVGNAALLNTTSKVVVGAINELKSTYDCCFSDLSGCISGVDNSKAPTSHASSATTYGVGNADCYGHVKISDEYTCCVGAAADGIAASQLAVYCVYQAVQSAAGLGNTAGCALGTASAGTCNSAARSDHVHPLPTCVACAGYATCASKDGSGCSFGTAARCAATAFRACTWSPSLVACSTCMYVNYNGFNVYAYICAADSSYVYLRGTCGTASKAIYVENANCASKDGSGYAFGTAARCAAGCFRPATWTPSCVACAGATGYCTNAWCGFCVCCSGIYMCICNRCAFPIVAFVYRCTSSAGIYMPVYLAANGKVCLDKQQGIPTGASTGAGLRVF